VKSGEDFVRVATNVQRPDGSRAIGTVLDPTGPAYAAIRKGEAYYGNAVILGRLYVTGYEPIRDESGAVVGIYYTRLHDLAGARETPDPEPANNTLPAVRATVGASRLAVVRRATLGAARLG
jgi:hypothetical protein